MARFTRTNTPLLEPTVAFMAGIAIFASWGYVVSGVALGAILAVFVLLKLLFFRRIASWRRLLLGWGLCFVAGAAWAGWRWVDPRPAAAHHGERLTFLGRVESIPQVRGRWERSTATLYCFTDSVSGDWTPLEDLTVSLYVDTAARPDTRLELGEIVRLRGRIYASDSTGYDLYMRRTQGITARCFAWSVARVDIDTTLGNRIALFRKELGNRLLQNHSDAAASIMQALAIGNPSDIDRSLRADYSRSGVAHLLAVSGLHVGIIFMILNLLFGWLRLIRHGLFALGGIVIVSLCGYAVLTGLSPSAVRAVVMFSLLQVGLMLSRSTNSLNTLCAASLLILVGNPYYIHHIGFRLSFAAMVGIITLYSPLARLWMPRQRVWRWLWSLTLVGITAQLGTFPLVMYHFGQLQLAGLLLNPLIWFTVPVIIVGSLLYLASGWGWVYGVTHTVTDLQNRVVDRMASYRWVAVNGIELSAWACAMLYVGVITLIVWVNRRSAAKTRSYFSDPSADEPEELLRSRAAK